MNTMGKTRVSSEEINKRALRIIITKAREIRFTIRFFFKMFRYRFASAQRGLLCKSHR